MIATAPMSSMIATVVRNNLSEVGARLPRSARTPIAKAISVAAGIAQPFTSPGSPATMNKYTPAGTIIPAAAAKNGRRRSAQVVRCPSTNSRLISSPTSRKNTAMRPSLTHRWTFIGYSLSVSTGPIGA